MKLVGAGLCNEKVEPEARVVTVYETRVLGFEPPLLTLEVECGKGTYVRSLADDMAAALGGSAHLTALRRTRTGSLAVDTHGLTIDQLEDWESHLLSPADALGDLVASLRGMPAAVPEEAGVTV